MILLKMLAVASGMRRASSIEFFAGGGGVFEEKVGRGKCHFFSWSPDAWLLDLSSLLDLGLMDIALDIGGAHNTLLTLLKSLYIDGSYSVVCNDAYCSLYAYTARHLRYPDTTTILLPRNHNERPCVKQMWGRA